MKEGKAVLDVEVCDKVSSDMPVFYNPRMKVNRDFSVAFARSVEDELTVLDCFSASGVMGLRYALECENIKKVIFNDKNREAFKAILKNIELNGGVFEKSQREEPDGDSNSPPPTGILRYLPHPRQRKQWKNRGSPPPDGRGKGARIQKVKGGIEGWK
jgi:tRNA G26 N,N-dimethylase Trm1